MAEPMGFLEPNFMKQTLHVLQSGSSGNGYIVDTGDEQLIIECGVPVNEALPKLDWDIKNVVGCVASHSHLDHCKYIKQYQKYFRVYSNPDVASKYDGVVALEERKRIRIGGFTIMPLKVPHGETDCYSFLIDHELTGRILFATDLSDFPFNVKGISTIMLECNYIESMIVDNLCNGEDVRSASQNHLELDACVSVVKRLYSPKLMRVVLLHLSNNLSDIKAIKKRFREELGLAVRIAEKNTAYPLSCEEF